MGELTEKQRQAVHASKDLCPWSIPTRKKPMSCSGPTFTSIKRSSCEPV